MGKQQPLQTQFFEGEGLKIPVLDLSVDSKSQILGEPETKRNTLLELLFEPEELSSLAIVKLNPDDDSQDPLKSIDFGDGIERDVAFSSGNSIYYADRELRQKLLKPFQTKKDHACRYGSLYVSSCNEGAVLFDSGEDAQPLRIKVVDFESQDDSEKRKAAFFQTGDCHGKISPRLAKLLGSKANRPFQFRLSWMQNWDKDEYPTPHTSFLAKGTFLPDKTLTDDEGYDIILDRSSIKGIAKNKLDDLIPCGDYKLPKAVLGNRGNAQTSNYQNSWQMSIWYSQEAISQDIVPPTLREAKELAIIQQDSLKLARYLVQQHDKKKQFLHTNDLDTFADPDQPQSETEERHESRMISLLRHDQYGQLLDFPKVADFMRSQLSKRWRDLAIKGAVEHRSAMAQPCDSLKPGTMVVPHLKDGEEVIVTRYPIVSKDNIRRYTVDNSQKPELKRYRGCAFIRSDQAMQHHQCDFDGDQLVITPASQLPSIAAETRHANDDNEYEQVTKRAKVDYTEVCREDGQRKYTKLRQVAAAVPRNSIGYVATLIGRVQSSVPQTDEPEGLFERRQRKLLAKLFDALQIEVDSPKSATRFQDYHPKLLETAQKWIEKYPSPLFDFKKDARLYKTISLPTEGNNPINVIAKDAVNPAWEKTRIRSRHRHEFRYLLPIPEDEKTQRKWKQHYLPWAEELKERYITQGREIRTRCGNDLSAIKEEYGKLYEDFRGEIAESFPTSKERQLAATALWYVETTNPNLNEPRKACEKLSRKLNIEFYLEENYQRQYDAFEKDTYLLSVPFKDRKGNDQAEKFKETFERRGISYEATLHPSLPMVTFALLDPTEKLIEVFERQYGNNDNLHLRQSDLTYMNGLGQIKNIGDRIVPPNDYTRWLVDDEDLKPKSALTLNLFTEEVSQQLQNYQFEALELIGQKHNDLAHIDFGDRRFQEKLLSFEVIAHDDPDNPRYGQPIVALKGKKLAMFSPDSPKLPIGATFKATIEPATRGSALRLDVDSESIVLPDNEPKQSFKLNVQLKPSISQSPLPDDILKKTLLEEYQKTEQPKVKIGNWTAFLNRKTQDCYVRNQNRQVIFQVNLNSGEIVNPLSQENRQSFLESLSQQPSAKVRVKSQQVEA